MALHLHYTYRMTSRLFALGSLLATLTAVACGGSPDPGVSGPEEATGAGNGAGGEKGGQEPSLGPTSNANADAGPSSAACKATASATAEARPVYLVFLYDRSGSMGASGLWQSSRDAVLAFLESPDSKGMSASVKFFPDNDQCDENTYLSPHVPMTTLPNPIFRNVIMSKSPGGDTPTKPALRGAIRYAEQIAQGQGKDGKVAVVLVTDGYPNVCNSSTNDLVADASRVRATIPTYVVGLGNLNGLDAVAQGGGTNKAFLVTGDANQTKASLQTALKQIQVSALACDYKLPAAPGGQTLDVTKVNVVYTSASAPAETLTYSQDCIKDGWRYDDPKAPTRIELCKATCDRVQQSTGKMDIEIGCDTKGGVPR